MNRDIIIKRIDDSIISITRQCCGENICTEDMHCALIELEQCKIRTLIIDGLYNDCITITMMSTDLSRLSSITNLSIAGCYIKGSYEDCIFDSMTHLSTISIGRCRTDDLPILRSLSRIKSIQKISLINIYSKYRRDNPDRLDIRDCTRLTELVLKGVSMKHIPFLPKSIRKCSIDQRYSMFCRSPPDCNHIYTKYSRITGGLNLIKWSELPNLEYLSITNTHLRGNIPKSICKATSLQYLDLSNNRLEGHIPWTLHRLSRVQCLNLSYNYLRGYGYIRSDSIEYLVLDYNHFRCIDIIGILTGGCPKIKWLSVEKYVLDRNSMCIDLNSVYDITAHELDLSTDICTDLYYNSAKYECIRMYRSDSAYPFSNGLRHGYTYRLSRKQH